MLDASSSVTKSPKSYFKGKEALGLISSHVINVLIYGIDTLALMFETLLFSILGFVKDLC